MNWHSGLPSLHYSTSDTLMADRFSEFGFPLASNPPSPSLSPALSPVNIDPFDTWQEATYSHHLLTPLELQTIDADEGHYSSCEGSSGNCSGYDSDMFPVSQEIINTRGMLQVPTAAPCPREMTPALSLNNTRFSPFPSSPSPQLQPQSLCPLDTSLAGTPIPGSPNPQHLDAAQFRVLMNEATNRIKALAEVDYAPMQHPATLATNIELLHPSPATLANAHNVPRVYLRRSHSVESLVNEPVWSTTAEQVGQLDSNQLLFQQQQNFHYIEQQCQQNQQQQQFDYSMPSTMAMIPTANLNPMNQLGMHMVQMNMGLLNNTYAPITVVDPRASSSMPLAKAISNRRPLSACSYTSTASLSFSAPSTTSPSPTLHSTTASSFASPISRKHQNLFPNIKTDVALAVAARSTSAAAFSIAADPRLQASSLPRARPKSLGNKFKSVNNSNNRDDNTRANGKSRSEHKPPINRFICPLPGCGRTFSRPFNLKSHGMTHETLRPYACDQCDKTFARIHDRDRHLKGHLIEKAHFCVVCLGRFARQDAVTRHLKLAKEKNPCAVILKEHGASFRDAAAGRILRSQLGDEIVLRRRFQELEEDVKKVKATKSLEKGMLSMHLLTMNHRPPLNIPLQKHQQLEQQPQTPLTSASQSPSTPQPHAPGRKGFESPCPAQ
ncbi:hypothetical protein BGW39_002071 [Mortierella sp. 14UC]|nr:hypothetical protein BGW39_002071 [Mortierella sp. 14UC]